MTLDPGRVQAIFLSALERDDPGDRAAILDRECRGDADLRRRVEALLIADGQPDGLLDRPFVTTAEQVAAFGSRTPHEPGDTNPPLDGPVAAAILAALTSRPIAEGPGSRVGPYRLLELIGEGGMGSVFLAEQEEPVRRRVAIEIIKPGMDSARVIARFEAERQALAMMDYHGIARVLDAGTTAAGRPYFVMELVRGVPITQYSDAARLTPHDRLALFLPVCGAILHAHQKGVIHRDIKPNNVLITLQDGVPVPKVIDFGIAKAIGQRLTLKTLDTEFGSIVGTLEYMSPEQAEMSPMGVDTRSDVYSLGAMLYELMTGGTPLERSRLEHSGYLEILGRIKAEETPRPSVRLAASGDAMGPIAARRGMEATKLARLLRGELDWIAMKALEKDRARRYETVGGLAVDIRNYLSGAPVEACPRSAIYRSRKFAREHRKGLAAAAAFVTLLIAGSVLSAWEAIRATRAEASANREALRATLAEARSGRERDRAVSAEARARAEAEKAERSAADERAVLAFFEDHVLAAARPEGQEGGLGKDVTIRQALDAAEPLVSDAFKDRPLVEAAIRSNLGQTYRFLGEPSLNLRQYQIARDLRLSRLGPDHRDTLESQASLAYACKETGRLAEALALFGRVLPIMVDTIGPDNPLTLSVQNNFAAVYSDLGRRAEAIALYEQALSRLTLKLGPNHPHALTIQGNLAGAYGASGDQTRAGLLAEKTLAGRMATLGPEHPDTLISQHNVAVHHAETGRVDEAISLHEQVLRASISRLGPDHHDTLGTQHALAAAYRLKGRMDKAIELGEKTLAARIARLGPDHPETSRTRNVLAAAYFDTGRVDGAIPLFEQTLKAQVAKLGPDHAETMNTQLNLANAYEKKDAFAKAEPLLRGLLHARKRVLAEGHLDIGQACNALGQNLLAQRRWAEAEPSLRASLAIRVEEMPDDWRRFNTASMLGGSLLGQARYADAEPFVLSGFEGMKSREAKIAPGLPTILMARAGGRVVRLYEATGREEEAAGWRSRLQSAAEEPPRDP